MTEKKEKELVHGCIIARELGLSLKDVEDLAKDGQIPIGKTFDVGTVWEANYYYLEDVLKAVKPKKAEAPTETATPGPTKKKTETNKK